MLVNKFLYSVINTDNNDTLFRLKDKFVDPKELKHVEFVKDYYAQYNKLPDLGTVETKFNIQLTDNTESAEFWYNEIYKSYQDFIIEQAVINSAKNKKNAVAVMQQAILDYNEDVDSKVIDYADTNRRRDSYKARKGTKGITYLSTGSLDLDSFSAGFKRADLWTIGGFEGAGKSWYLFRMAVWLDMYMLSQNIRKNILIVSGEMEAFEVEDRIDAIRAQLSYSRLSKGELTPKEERAYLRYLRNLETNIKIVDSFDGMKDVGYFQTLYRPAITFIDGSHLMAKSYDWTEIARVTADMKKLSRNHKIPIINTTHLKAEKGRSSSGGSIDDFAYTKGYTRDSDIVGVMFASEMMEVENKIGIDWVKVRRGNRSQMIWQNDYDTAQATLIETKAGLDLVASDKPTEAGKNNHNKNGRGNTVEADY